MNVYLRLVLREQRKNLPQTTFQFHPYMKRKGKNDSNWRDIQVRSNSLVSILKKEKKREKLHKIIIHFIARHSMTFIVRYFFSPIFFLLLTICSNRVITHTQIASHCLMSCFFLFLLIRIYCWVKLHRLALHARLRQSPLSNKYYIPFAIDQNGIIFLSVYFSI